MTIHRHTRIIAAALLAACTLSASACGNYAKDSKPKINAIMPTGTAAGSYYEKSSITDKNGRYWIPLKPAVQSLGYRMKDDSDSGGYTKIGYTDVMYMLKPSSNQVFSLGQKVTLVDPPKIHNKQIYVTPAALSKLLQTEVGWNPGSGEINIAPPKDPVQPRAANSINGPKTLRIQSASNVDVDALIDYAKTFLGTPYDFGTGPYEETKKFDCSSFTRHVFKKFGVKLPRLAREQDDVGTRIQRSELQKGDLVFFTVPGRFDSDAVPGHVGIYIGGGKMIHTWGDPGVQISDMDSGYWSTVILHMSRVL